MSSGYFEVVTSQKSDDWGTPQGLVDQLAAEFGPFDLDPAADADNAKAPVFYTADDDGLALPWKGRVWMNPPYSEVGQWMAKAEAETATGNAELVVCLVPARVDARWYRDASASAALVRVLPFRVKFGGCRDSAPFPNAVIVFGKLTGRHGTKAVRCALPSCKRWFWPTRCDAKTCSAACRQGLKRSQITGRKRDRKTSARTLQAATPRRMR